MAELKSRITPVQQMISSCTGAVMTAVFVTPLDVVKIRLQAQQKTMLGNRCFLYCNGFVEQLCCNVHGNGNAFSSSWYQQPRHLTGTVDAFVKITKAEGVTSLWSGLPPTLLMAVPATVVYFTMYDQLKARMIKKYSLTYQPLWIPALAGGLARTIAVTLISPLELVRTKMQSQKLSYREIGEAVRNLVSNQGLHSMWRGLGPTILRDVPFSCIYWSNYEALKSRFGKHDQPPFWFSFAAGATAGTISAILTLPFDVIKTHRQIELGEMEALTRPQTISTYSRLKTLYQFNGYKGLFAGAVPRIVKVAPACAIMISSYEYGKSFFYRYNASKASNAF